ncbi:hypothetical protein BH23BAC1_BH23BAC1_25610 [soil metagenome]
MIRYPILIYFIGQDFTYSLKESEPVIAFCIWLVFFWFLIAQGAKRCHDRGHSGLYQVIPFYWFWMLFAHGDEGKNKYDLIPKDLKVKNL